MAYNESRKLSTMKYRKKMRVEKPFESRKLDNKSKARTFIRKYADVSDLQELISFASSRIDELQKEELENKKAGAENGEITCPEK